MATKKEIRQALICRLIRNNHVPNQKTLRELLLINGISATQATISRDMYELNITKDRYSREDISCYRMPSEQARATQDVFRVMGTKGFRSIHYSGSFVVLKTRSGYAHSICVDIDSIANNAIVGTIAGNDTILVIPADGVSHEEVVSVLAQIIPELARAN